MFCKNNEQQLSVCHRDANMKYQTHSSSSAQVFFIRLSCFSIVFSM